jgi:hypothetical protein
MFELSNEMSFRLKAADEVGSVGLLGLNDLDSDIPADFGLTGAVDDSVGPCP